MERRIHFTKDSNTPLCKNYKYKGTLTKSKSDVNCGACSYQIKQFPHVLISTESDNEKEPCYVYVITAYIDIPILLKIGISNNPEQRILSLKQEPLIMKITEKKIFGSRKEALEKEYFLHQKFKDFLFYGEWFRYDSSIEKCLENINF